MDLYQALLDAVFPPEGRSKMEELQQAVNAKPPPIKWHPFVKDVAAGSKTAKTAELEDIAASPEERDRAADAAGCRLRSHNTSLHNTIVGAKQDKLKDQIRKLIAGLELTRRSLEKGSKQWRSDMAVRRMH